MKVLVGASNQEKALSRGLLHNCSKAMDRLQLYSRGGGVEITRRLLESAPNIDWSLLLLWQGQGGTMMAVLHVTTNMAAGAEAKNLELVTVE